MQINSVTQAQIANPLAALLKSNIGPGVTQEGQNATPPSTNVSISAAAYSKNVAAQQNNAPILPVGVQHMLQEMVDNPKFAAQYANGYATNTHTAAMSIGQFLQVKDTLYAGQAQLQAVWQNIQGQGKSPAQSFADLLAYEQAMPQSYWNAQDPGNTTPNIQALAAAKLAYLQQCIAGQSGTKGV